MSNTTIKLEPRDTRVVLARVKEETVTATGLIIPKGTTERQDIAIVISVGKNVPDDIIVGQKVLYKPYSTLEIKINNEEFLVIEQTDISCNVIEKE